MQALFAARRKGIDFGLQRIRDCLQALALPKPGIVVQVAGTNGKGSTCQMLACALRASGLSVGVFSSPHLLTVCERFGLDDGPVSRDRFLAAYQAIEVHAGVLTFFEQMTAMATWIFADAKVDVAIYEVGLGGRLDSTTALEVDLSLVSGIALDHEEFLGSTLEDIAKEKAGIFRPGVPALVGLSASSAIRESLAAHARNAGAVPILVDDSHLARVPASLRLAGLHQRRNAALVVAACESLIRSGIRIPEEAISTGLSSASLSGRFQKISDFVWVDGAHNAQAAEALAALLSHAYPGERWVMVVGLSQEKRIADFLRPLLPHCSRLVVTSGASDRAQDVELIADAADVLGVQAHIVASVSDALAWAQATFPRQRILVTGSILLLGELLASLGHGLTDPLWLSDPSRRA